MVLLKALAANVNQGYQNVNSWVVEKVNGEKIWNLRELIEKVENSLDPYIVFEDKWGQQIVVEREKSENTHQEILQTYRIPFDRSEDLRK